MCFEPVKEMLEGAAAFDNVEAHCGGAIEFARDAPDESFDLIFTNDTAHHFAANTLSTIHEGFCSKLKIGGRYAMVVRTPPDNEVVPVGRIASEKWPSLFTPLGQLMSAMRGVKAWKEAEFTRWEQPVETPAKDWIDGVMDQDTWSIFSTLSSDEITTTVQELESRFADQEEFEFLHQYDVAVFEKG